MMTQKRIWFNERLAEYHWVLLIDGSQEHYSGTAKTVEQAEKDIIVCTQHFETTRPVL